MEEYQKLLADRLLSEERPITYRLLSRALDVHVNSAKSMLYEFHKYQNSLRADSIRATYLLYGTKYNQPQLEEDVEMSSSFADTEPESFSEPVLSRTMTLVSEERLEDLLREYQNVTSIHVYSLAPAQQKDRATLVDVAQSISEYAKQGDPVTSGTKHGAIQNLHVRRRERSNRPIPQATTSKAQPAKSEPSAEKPVASKIDTNQAGSEKRAETSQKIEEPSKPQIKDAVGSSANAGRKSVPYTNRSNSGSIMQSFAKAASKPASKVAKSVKKEDGSTTALSDDGEADDSDFISAKPTSNQKNALHVNRKEREENLRRMMEENLDDDESKEAIDEDDSEDSSLNGKEEEPELDIPAVAETDANAEEKVAPTERVSTSENGRRRVRRRVMKKKRYLDEKGYMVTTQEPAWESFSEEEPAPKKAVKEPSPNSTPTAKMKKEKGKPGQGNIRSFFPKK